MFTCEQKVYDIAGVRIGGQPGERPTVLVGSIFYSGHKIVTDPLAGVFDHGAAEELLAIDAQHSARTGNPRFIDVIGDTGPALIKYIEFVAEHTDAPLLVDSFSQQVRMETLRYFAGSEVAPRLIYNSIAEDLTDAELDCLAECSVKSAVLMAFSTSAPRPRSRLKLLVDTLLPAAARARVENVLVDPGVLDIPSVGWTAAALREIKETLGYPCGCAPSNALYTWEKLRALGRPDFEAAGAATFVLTQAQGADFVHYGPLRHAPWVYTAVSTCDAMMAYAGRLEGVRPVDDHPLYRIF